MYLRWFQELATQGVKVNYQSVGSGAGVRQFTAGSVDFGASDVPMSAKEIAAVKAGVVQIPMTGGAIAVAYNNPGCSLKLSQVQLAQIFLGTLSNYSQLGCKSKAIRVVHRSDGSGTTANFTAHLSAISPEWQKGPGQGKSVAWPTGIGAKGNEGMASQLSQLDGGVGYLESAYVTGLLQAASLTNASGQLVAPTQASEKEALASITLDDKLTGGNPNPVNGYPIVSLTWILLNQQGNGVKLDTIKKAFGFTLSDQAQAMAPQLGFITLPAEVLVKARKALAGIR
jgi:phosphate transport system substrate-binding protein